MMYIAVPVEYVGPETRTPALLNGAELEKVEGTSFVTALQLECTDPALREHIEEAYRLLREDLKRIKP